MDRAATRHHAARLVLFPAEVTLAGASEGITVVLAEHGATCVVVGRSDTPAAPAAARVAGV